MYLKKIIIVPEHYEIYEYNLTPIANFGHKSFWQEVGC